MHGDGLPPKGVNSNIYVMNSDGSELRQITFGNYQDQRPAFSPDSKTIVFVSDLFPSTVHVRIPYVMAYDNQPLITLKEKKEFLNEALENDYILFFEHDVYHECCSLQITDKGIEIKDTFTLEDIF